MFRPESMHSLKRTKGSDGKALPGLWENHLIRMELVDVSWHCEVPMRRIGETNFYEFRPLEMGGHWHSIGTYRSRASACIIAQRMHDGTHIYQGAYNDDAGKVPGYVLPWTEVATEIAAHPSVTGKS